MRSIQDPDPRCRGRRRRAFAFSAEPRLRREHPRGQLDDVLYGTPYADTITGFEGNDSLYGYAGAD